MNDSSDHLLLQANDVRSFQVAGLAGCWKLGAGRALSLQARHAGVLRISRGRVWATFDHADQRRSTRAGDHFLGRGDSVYLQPGESLVMEAWGSGRMPSACFGWEPAPASRSVAARGNGALGAPGLVRGMGQAVTRGANALVMLFASVCTPCNSAE